MNSEQQKPLVYVIILTWNGRNHLESCIPSLMNTSYPNFKTILIDNGSHDGSSEYVAQHFPPVRILRNTANLGFAKANNMAMKMALDEGAKYVLLLNDDVVLLDSRWLSEAVEAAEKDIRIGMIGFQLTSTRTRSDSISAVVVADTERIDGCALLIRSSLLIHLGLFDEVYFAYSEEDDLEARAIKAGYKLKQMNIAVFHLGGGTSRKYPIKASYLQIRNSIRYSIKNRSSIRTILRIIRLFDISCNPIPFFFNSSDPSHCRMRNSANIIVNLGVYLAALLWNCLFLTQTLLMKHKDERRIRATKFWLLDSRIVRRASDMPRSC